MRQFVFLTLERTLWMDQEAVKILKMLWSYLPFTSNHQRNPDKNGTKHHHNSWIFLTVNFTFRIIKRKTKIQYRISRFRLSLSKLKDILLPISDRFTKKKFKKRVIPIPMSEYVAWVPTNSIPNQRNMTTNQ